MVREDKRRNVLGTAVALALVLTTILLATERVLVRPVHATPGTTTLAFRTAPGGVTIPPGQSKTLGAVNVGQFAKIRVVADERAGSPTSVTIRLTITEGNELVAQLDTLTLSPHSQVTRVYDVPGVKLTVFADAAGGGAGSDGLDVLIYGSN